MNRHSSNFTFILPTYNEAASCCIFYSYYDRYGSVACIDNYSSDNTPTLLKEAGAEFLYQYKNPGTIQTPEWTRFALGLVSTPYAVFCSCSEVIPRTLLDELDLFAQKGAFSLIRCAVRTYTNGESINIHGGTWRSLKKTVVRIVKVSDLDVNSIRIHGLIVPKPDSNLPVIDLSDDERYTIFHIRTTDTASLLHKHSAYARNEAFCLANNHESLSKTKLCALILKELLKVFQNKSSHWNFNLQRELALRIVMHILIYLYYTEIVTLFTIDTSRQKSLALINELTR